jgi:hypothetical protein
MSYGESEKFTRLVANRDDRWHVVGDGSLLYLTTKWAQRHELN